jgi:hypothetical protein
MQEIQRKMHQTKGELNFDLKQVVRMMRKYDVSHVARREARRTNFPQVQTLLYFSSILP